jgi:hypothetical protein
MYEGPTYFELGLVEFVVLNDSDDANVGFSVWQVPDGTTADDIAAVVFEAGPPL